MTKTKEVVRFLKKRLENDLKLRQYYEEEKINLQVAQAIRDAREAEGLTQKGLAEMIGTTQSVISRLEDADYEGHSLSMLQRIATALRKRLSIRMDSFEEVA